MDSFELVGDLVVHAEQNRPEVADPGLVAVGIAADVERECLALQGCAINGTTFAATWLRSGSLAG